MLPESRLLSPSAAGSEFTGTIHATYVVKALWPNSVVRTWASSPSMASVSAPDCAMPCWMSRVAEACSCCRRNRRSCSHRECSDEFSSSFCNGWSSNRMLGDTSLSVYNDIQRTLEKCHSNRWMVFRIRLCKLSSGKNSVTVTPLCHYN